jgi:hypothetical protein
MMRIWNQWKSPDGQLWGVSLFGVFWTVQFAGFTLLGFVFEWPRK